MGCNQFGTTVKPGKLGILDIDDTFSEASNPLAAPSIPRNP